MLYTLPMDPINPIAGNPEALNQNQDTSKIPSDSHGITIAALAIFILLSLAAVAFLYYQNQQLKTMIAGCQSSPTPSPIATTTADPTVGWKIYTNQAFGFTLKYPDFYSPADKFVPVKGGKPVFIITAVPNFVPKSIALCKTYQENICLIPGKNWNQLKDVQPVSLAGKNAVSFFITTKTTDGGNNVIHVVQTSEKPFVEIALTVDGMGGEETFQQILSTFQFIQPSASPIGKTSTPPLVACTMEAKLCPDGSSVGRTGPNCEFAPCPQAK
jgi:hypothetical protein